MVVRGYIPDSKPFDQPLFIEKESKYIGGII